MNAEAEGIVLLAGVAQARAVEGQRVDLFQRRAWNCLPLFAITDDQPSTSPA